MTNIFNPNQDEEELQTGLNPEAPSKKRQVFHGAQAVEKVSENLGRPLTLAEQRVVEEEGYDALPYYDTKGILTQGVGQTGEWIDKGFEAAFEHHVDRTKNRISGFDELPEYLQAELVQAEYRGDLGQSPKFVELFNNGFYNTASTEFLDHKEYRESKQENGGVARRMERVSSAVDAFGSGDVLKRDAVPEAATFLKDDLEIANSGFVFIDGDTWKNKETGEKFRFAGIDFAETNKVLVDKGFIRGEAGGNFAKNLIPSILNKYGFTIPVLTEQDAGYERKIGDFKDKDGNLASDFLIEIGLAKPSFIGKSKETMSEDQYARYVYNLRKRGEEGPKTDLEIASELLKVAEHTNTNGQFVAKKRAFNEAEFALLPEIFSGVVLRNKNATFDNRSKVPYSQSFDNALTMAGNAFRQVGVMGADLMGLDDAKRFLEYDIDYEKTMLKRMPKVRLDYKDVDWTDLGQVSEYVGANLAMSLPFMGVTGLSLLLKGPTMGASLALPVTMYTGLILDEMPGETEEKSYALAVAGGSIAAALDVFGLRGALGLMRPSQFMTGEAKEEAIKAVMNAKGESLEKVRATLGKDAAKLLVGDTVTREAAEIALGKATKRQVAALSADVKAKVDAQLAKSVVLKQFTKRLLQGAAFEGSTEMLQELTQYTAAVLGSEKVWDFEELENRLINASVAGTIMGSGFSIPGTVWEAGAWKDASVATAEYDNRYDSAKTSWKAEERSDNDGRERDLDEVIGAEWKEINDRDGVPLMPRGLALPENFSELSEFEQYEFMNNPANFSENVFEKFADAGQERSDATPKSDKLGTLLMDPMRALRSAVATRISVDLMNKSKSARLLYSMLIADNNSTYQGVNFTSDKVNNYISFEKLFSKDADLRLDDFKLGTKRYGKQRTELSNLVYDFYDTVIKPITRPEGTTSNKKVKSTSEIMNAIDWDNLPVRKDSNGKRQKIQFKENSEPLKSLIQDLYNIDESIYNGITSRQIESGEALIGELQDHVFRSKSFLKDKIAANKEKFAQILSKEKNLSIDVATEVTETILDNPDAHTLEDAFDLTRGGLYPSGFKRRSLDIADSRAFDEFLQNNILDNLEQQMKGAARYMASMRYLGKDSKLLSQVMSKIYNELVASGEPNAQEIVEDLAKDVRDLVNADSGNYKRIESDAVRGGQKFATLFGVLTMLPLAAPMSIVEFALAPLGVNLQAFNKNVGSFGMVLGQQMYDYFKTIGRGLGAPISRSIVDTSIKSRKKKLIENDDPRYVMYDDPAGLTGRVGMSNQRTGQATLVGVSETSELTKTIMDSFFKFIGLTNVTNASRQARASIYNDFLINHLDIIESSRGMPTNASAESRQMLEEMGLPVDRMLDLSRKLIADPNNVSLLREWERQFDNGLYNFVNAAVPMPQAMSRPLIYSDPHFALFMQFQGFISQFTATHIPRIYRLATKGTPGMKYSAFATMTSMLMLGYAAQHLKDLIKFGEGTPYLTDNEKYLRALYSSGLLGTTERILSNNYLFPLYKDRTRGVVESTWSLVSGEAPASNIVENTYKLFKGVLEEDSRATIKSATSLTPVVSPLKHRFYDGLVENNWITGD